MIFFDLETSGLSHARHEVIQIAAVVVNDRLDEIAAFEAKLQFDTSSADPKSLEMNSYDPVVWEAESRPPADVYWEFAEFVWRHHDGWLAGHNAARFDVPFIQAMFAREGLALPDFEIRDTYLEARDLLRDLPERPANFRLGTLCEWFGVPLENAHDALADVRATVEVWQAIHNVSDVGPQNCTSAFPRMGG